MKLLILTLFLVSCASKQHVDVNPYTSVVGDTYEKVVKGWGTSWDCFELNSTKYCVWKNQVHVFEQGILTKKIEKLKDPTEYEVTVDSMTTDGERGTFIHLMPGNENVNVEGVEWRRSLPVLKQAFSKAGYNISEFQDGADQLLKLDFGIIHLTDDSAKRFLTIVSVNPFNPRLENWKVSVSSVGLSRDFYHILPILLTAGLKYISAPENLVKSERIQESSLMVHAYRHQLKI